MTSDPNIRLRVDRLQNDTESIYELVGDFRTDFNDFRTDFNDFRTGFNDFRTGFHDFRTETRGRFDRIEETMTELVRRLPEPS